MTTLTNYSLTGANGDTIVFDYENFVLNGIVGANIPTTRMRIDESAGNGGTWRNTKRGVRDISLAITVMGIDRADVETKLRRLAKLTQDTLGPTTISALYSDNSSLTLEAHYSGGAEGNWNNETTGLVWCRWVMTFQAPQPFWQSADSQTFTVTAGNTGRGLLPQLSKLKVSSSQSFGIVSVTNNADVEAYPIWTIRGPIAGLVITNGTDSFGFNVTVADGKTYVVDTEAGTVTDESGANKYSILNPAPKLFPFQPGVSNIEIRATEASTSSATFISCSYSLRYEVVH